MDSQSFFGEYNHIYFLREGKWLSGICDRAHRKQTVCFAEEEVTDLANRPKEEDSFYLSGTMPSPDAPIELGGRQFKPAGLELHEFHRDFGRSLKYQRLADQPGRCTALLTVELPEWCRYRVRWDPASQQGAQFTLAEGMLLTVETELIWRYECGTLVVETGKSRGEIHFLVESLLVPSRIQDRVIVATRGFERAAILARAACGAGFVPCFILDRDESDEKTALQRVLEKIPHHTLIGIGTREATALTQPGVQFVAVDVGLQSSAQIDLNQQQDVLSRVLLAPDCPEAYGPALLLALQYGAALHLGATQDGQISLTDATGELLQDWKLSELIGVPLQPFPSHDRLIPEAMKPSELVVCENTLTDLLICQAIGYADLIGCPIAFVPAAGYNSGLVDGFPDEATGTQTLERLADSFVPLGLRTPEVDLLTIFTAHLPLHLTPIPSQERSPLHHWMDKYRLAHLPGQVASQLVPRFLRQRMQEAPSVSFAVIFDVLQAAVNTEGRVYDDELARGLSYPIVLSRRSAHKQALREVLQRLDTDLVLLITHGSGDHIEDGLGNIIASEDITQWALRGAPVVFNNSCTSWATTGRAFVDAGARAYIGTLWPVANKTAAAIAGHLGKQLHAQDSKDVSSMLREALLHVMQGDAGARGTTAAYLYVGLPDSRLLTRPALNEEEKLSLLAATFNALYKTLGEIAREGRPDVATAVHQAVRPALLQRFREMIVPGEVPPQLPWPMAYISVLDVDYLFATADFAFGMTLLDRLPLEQQSNVVNQMEQFLWQALQELVAWDERHDAHLGRTQEDRDELARKTGAPIGAQGEMGFYAKAAVLTLQAILPFVDILTKLREIEQAHSWLQMAAKLVTTRNDLSADGTVSYDALNRRLREGVIQRMRILVGDGLNTETSIDVLANAVNKSRLANSFGIALLHLEEYRYAADLFETARDLAERGSADYTNAVSNLANVHRLTHPLVALSEYQTALKEQESQGNYRNAMVTAANLLRLAAKARTRIDETIVSRALSWVTQIDDQDEQLIRKCDILGGIACYRASQGSYDQAKSTCAEIGQILRMSSASPQFADYLNQLAGWYYEVGEFSRAVSQAFDNASILATCGLLPDATRTYVMAGDSALRSYEQTKREKDLGAFLDCSFQVGQILRLLPGLRDELAEWLETMWTNTQSLWRQLADHGKRELALKAYRSVTAWDATLKEASWERLSDAFHPRNQETIQSLAASGSLLRQANISIDKKMTVTVEIVTSRQDNYGRLTKGVTPPESIYGYLPLYSSVFGSTPRSAKAIFVAGVAVYTLRHQESVTVREENVQCLRTDGKGTFLYDEVWGSRVIPYRLNLSLPPGFVPLRVEIKPVTDTAPKATLQFSRAGCRIRCQHETDRGPSPWLATISVLFHEVPELADALTIQQGAADEMPLELYRLLLRIAAR